MKDLCKNWWNRIRSRPDSDRIQALPISSPQSINDEFHSLGPMSPVSPGDFVTEDYVDMADDQRDGFYRYSASIYGDDTPSPTESLIVRPSSNDDLSDHFIMASSRRHSRPYTISSDEWVVPSSSSSSSQVLPMDDLDAVQLSIHFGTVMKIFTRVYAMAKLLQVVLRAYGVEPDGSINGLDYWTKRAEDEIRTDRLATLVEIVEHLFYTLYARLQIEMAAIELCSLIRKGARPLSTHFKFILPNNKHLYRIFEACNDFLDSPVICGRPRAAIIPGLVVEFQECHIYSLIPPDVAQGIDDDPMGLRQSARRILSYWSSPYRKKWNGLIPFFDTIPIELMVVLCEKYFTIIPKKEPELDTPLSELGLVDLKTVDPERWEEKVILDHRLSALSILEGKAIGEMRRADPNTSIFALAKVHKCICNGACFCAEACTRSDGVERWCPCSERHFRIMTARSRSLTGLAPFNIRTNTLSWVCFQGLAGLKEAVPQGQLLLEIFEMFNLFEMEIQKQRGGLTAAHWA